MAEKAREGADRIRFSADVVVLADRSIVRLPAEASAALPSRGQVAVRGEMSGKPFEAVLEPDGMRGHWLGVDSSLAEGETVAVEIERSDAWPEPQVPAEFEQALAEAPAADETWGDITPMARWEWVRWVNATKNPQTRDRRIEVSMSKLGKGMRRPCCFDLASCTDPELSKNGKLLGLS
ncbi:YdeI/OmpD-associated family protein [Herbiconiux sp. UC225_62]|uniref:YdeI/OmpD-associated family protein n=1 Tax=Herbiconiux sp. UC225_62 TaxID=3350168 RepID=UPI0036D2BB62